MKAVVWSEYGGAAATGVLISTIQSGKVLPNVKDLDLWTAAGLVAVDILVEDHLHPVGQEIMNGVGSYSIGFLFQKLMSKYAFGIPFNPVLSSGSTQPVVTTVPSSSSSSSAAGTTTTSSTSSSSALQGATTS